MTNPNSKLPLSGGSWATVLILFIAFMSQVFAERLGVPELLIGRFNATLSTTCASDPNPLSPQQEHYPERERKRFLFRVGKRREIPYSLAFFRNGTFILDPHHQQEDDANSLRGVWSLSRNPYCVTDRFYDQLILQTPTWNCTCRLTGHFSRVRPKFGLAVARLSHGVVRRNDDRMIQALLKAQRVIPSIESLQEECYDQPDREEFGY